MPIVLAVEKCPRSLNMSKIFPRYGKKKKSVFPMNLTLKEIVNTLKQNESNKGCGGDGGGGDGGDGGSFNGDYDDGGGGGAGSCDGGCGGGDGGGDIGAVVLVAVVVMAMVVVAMVVGVIVEVILVMVELVVVLVWVVLVTEFFFYCEARKWLIIAYFMEYSYSCHVIEMSKHYSCLPISIKYKIIFNPI